MKDKLLFFLLIICLCACGCGEEDVENEKIPVNFVSADPPSGSGFPRTIQLTFDGVPEDVETSAGVVVVAGRIVIINGPFTPGPLNITVTWSDGSITLTYTV